MMATKIRDNRHNLTGPEKAAIVFLCVSYEQGAALMEQLEPQEITALTRAMAGLGTVSASLVEEVIGEFTEALAQGTDVVGNYSTAEQMLLRFMPEEQVNAIMDEVRGPLQGRNMWERLSELNEGIIARYLRGEYPQTVAAILTKMRPDITAKVLPLLPPAMMLDVVERMIRLEAIPRDIYGDIEEALKEEFLAAATSASSSDPHERMAEVFNRVDPDTLQGLFAELEQSMPEALERIKQRMFTFEDLQLLDRQALSRVFRTVDGRTLPIALKGVSEELREEFLLALPERSRNILLEEMENLGPIRVREVQEAQSRIVEAAKQLAEDGQIVLPQGTDDDQMID